MDSSSTLMRYLPEIEDGALSALLAEWKAQHPGLGVCVFLPEAEKAAVGTVQQIFARLSVPLVGAIFPALISEHHFCTSGLLLLGFSTMPYAALYERLPVDVDGFEQKVADIAQSVGEHLDDTPETTLFLLFDAMVPNISTLLDLFYLKLGNQVHYAGANAGSETFQPMPCLFDGQRLVEGGVLLMLLKPHCGAILEHGYRAPDHLVYATSTEGNRISQIDWRPAFEVYQELIWGQYQVELTAENFYQLAVHYPFGIVRANHHVLVRIPVMLGDDGSLFCVGEVPPNAVLTLLERPVVDSGHTLQVLENGVRQLKGNASISDLVLFYCAGRRLHLGIEVATGELTDLSERISDKRICGALTLGEIGGSTTWGYPLFHNATLLALLWRKE